MGIPYFPGCTMTTTGAELDRLLRKVMEALGEPLVEVPDWRCCGAVAPHAGGSVYEWVAPARVLGQAERMQLGPILLTACSTCYNVLRRTARMLQGDPERREAISALLGADGPVSGEIEVWDILRFLRDRVGFDRVAAAVRHPLRGLRVAAYYGCMVLHPTEVAYDDVHFPYVLDALLSALGAEPVDWTHKTHCCGAYVATRNVELAHQMASSIVDAAAQAGAQSIVTVCPLCRFHLGGRRLMPVTLPVALPVFHFIQLLAVALGVVDETEVEATVEGIALDFGAWLARCCVPSG